jgi:hypothetical protein
MSPRRAIAVDVADADLDLRRVASNPGQNGI